MTFGSPLTGRSWPLLWLAVVFCLAFLLPNHYSPWLSVHQELATWIAFAPLLIWASFSFKKVPILSMGAVLLACVPVLQIARGQLYFSADGWMAFLYLMGFAFAVLAGAHCVGNGSSPAYAELLGPWTGLVLAALISVGIAAFQWLLMGNQGIYTVEMPPNARPFGNLAQPNQLATLLLLGLAGIMFLWESHKLRVFVAMAAAFVLTFGLVMTGSRTVFLALLWLVPAFWGLRRRCRLRTSPYALLLIVGFYFISVAAWPALNAWLLMSPDTISVIDRMGSAGTRKIYWLSMLDALWRAPWFGYGWGQISLAQTATTLDYPAPHESFDSAHNIFLDLALWNGIPIAALVFCGLLTWGIWQVKRCKSSFAFVLLVAIGIVWSHALVEFPLNYAYFLLPVGLWMGALSTSSPMLLAFDKSARFLKAAQTCGGVLAVAVLALGASIAIEYFPYEEDWRLMRYQEQRIGNLAHTDPPPVRILTNLHEFMVVARMQIRPSMSADELERMRRVSERYAYASSMYRYAMAQAVNHQPQAAQKTLRRLCQMQSEKACAAAAADWKRQGASLYPQLADTPFPDSVSTD